MIIINIFIIMHLNQIFIKFSHNEKYELMNIINGFKEDIKEERPIDKSLINQQDIDFKNNLVNFIKSAKNELHDKSRCIQRLKQLLIEEKCMQSQQNKSLRQTGNNSLNIGIQKLGIKIVQMSRNNQIFQLFIGFLQEMKDLRQDRLYQFQYKLSKANKLNRMQREMLALIAKKLVKVDSLSKMSDVEDDIIAFFNKIMRYGIHQQFNQVQRMKNQEIKNKCFKLLEYLQNNCIQIKQQFNPIRSLLKKLSISIYDKSEILNSLSQLNENIRLIFQPVCNEVFRLREAAIKTSCIVGDTGLIYVSHDMKKTQQQSFQSLKKEKEELKNKYTALEEDLRRTKLILQKLGHMSNLFKQERLYQTIQQQLGNSSQELKIYLQRIYNHLKTFQELTLGARKASFIERKDNQIDFLQQKLSAALQEIDILRQSRFQIREAQSLLIEQNNEFEDRNSQNQRIKIQYQTEMNNLNTQIAKYSKQINNLTSQLMESEKQMQILCKEKTQMQKQIETLLNLKNNQELQYEKKTNMLNQQIQIQVKSLKQQNVQLLNKCKQRSYEHNELQQKKKEITSLKHLQEQNLQLIELINRLNKEIQSKQLIMKQRLVIVQRQDQFVQTSQTQSKESSQFDSKSMLDQIRQLKEEKAKLEFLNVENDQLKQQRFFRLNEQKQMKRIYRQSRADISQIESELEQYKESYQKLGIQYQNLKKRYNQLKFQQYQRKKQSKCLENYDTQKQNLKKMQQKHRLLQKNFEQVKKYNDLLKNEYHRLKQETNHTIKAKIKDIIAQYSQNQKKLKKQIQHLSSKCTQLTVKFSILQQQNLNIKFHLNAKIHQKHDLSSLRQKNDFLMQSLNIQQLTQQSDSKQKLRQELRIAKIKHQQERIHSLKEIKTKDQYISTQRIQILKLQQKLDKVVTQLNKLNLYRQQSSEAEIFSKNEKNPNNTK